MAALRPAVRVRVWFWAAAGCAGLGACAPVPGNGFDPYGNPVGYAPGAYDPGYYAPAAPGYAPPPYRVGPGYAPGRPPPWAGPRGERFERERLAPGPFGGRPPGEGPGRPQRPGFDRGPGPGPGPGQGPGFRGGGGPPQMQPNRPPQGPQGGQNRPPPRPGERRPEP